MANVINAGKQQVKDFWNDVSCGENLYLDGTDRAAYELQARKRYELEPYILEFACFEDARSKCVLEVGVGLGADHQRFAAAGCDLYGVDLTERAVEHTRRRLAALGLTSQLAVGDAERLGLPDGFFDIVYSWGVIHHSPNTPAAVSEIWRVLKPGGVARVMIYHTWSLIGMMLWIRYALLRLRPWLSLRELYSRYLESPGTKAYSVAEAREMFSRFSDVCIQTVLTHGDLLESEAGQRHGGVLLTLARRLWPRAFFRRFMSGWGLFMLIEARK